MADAPTVETKATLRYLQVSPFKIRQVLPLIRGRSVEEAERVLEVCERDAAADVLKVLESAIANAGHNRSIPPDELYVSLAFCDEGPTRNHGQARARGRYFRVRKRSSHLTIVVARLTDEQLETRRGRDETSGGGRGREIRSRVERVRASRAAARRAAEGDDHDHDDGHDDGHEGDHEVDQAPTEDAAQVGAGPVEDVEVAQTAVERDGDVAATGETEKVEESE